jgi:hypothetical protein
LAVIVTAVPDVNAVEARIETAKALAKDVIVIALVDAECDIDNHT